MWLQQIEAKSKPVADDATKEDANDLKPAETFGFGYYPVNTFYDYSPYVQQYSPYYGSSYNYAYSRYSRYAYDGYYRRPIYPIFG